MVSQHVTFPTPDGLIDGQIVRPDSSEVLPGVIHLTDIFGIRPATEDLAERMAKGGYVVFTPNIF